MQTDGSGTKRQQSLPDPVSPLLAKRLVYEDVPLHGELHHGDPTVIAVVLEVETYEPVFFELQPTREIIQSVPHRPRVGGVDDIDLLPAMYFDVEVRSFLPAVVSDVRSIHDYRTEGKDTEEEGDAVVEEMDEAVEEKDDEAVEEEMRRRSERLEPPLPISGMVHDRS